ncbi:class I SAM-dependent methyltransferase [Dokdonella soli]|uniref:rRNA adenine N-6-methyltransferase family protein n=1 Tax=Dokdonella soli TaxID=529810 RepID=A0ABP3TKC5_9GAMM
MSNDPTRPGMTAPDEIPAAWTFFRQWLKNPRAMAAFSPSGRQLARQMVAQLPVGAQRVVELGGGTGAFTRALIERGIAPRDLLVLELNGELYQLLRQRFPDAHVVNGDARDLAGIVGRTGFAGPSGVDAVISGLGFLAMPRQLQKDILQAVFSVLGPDRPLIQFTYGPSSPIPRELLDELGLNARRAGVAWRNVPPARIYVYTRNRSTPIHAVRVGDSV